MNYGIVPVHFSGKTFSINSNSISTLVGSALSQAESLFINENGDTMKGDLNMNQNQIIDIREPKTNNEVVNKGYLDNSIKYFDQNVRNFVDIEVSQTKSSLTLELIKLKDNLINIPKLLDTKINDHSNTIEGKFLEYTNQINNYKNQTDKELNKNRNDNEVLVEKITKTKKDILEEINKSIQKTLEETNKTVQKSLEETNNNFHHKISSISSLKRLEDYNIIHKMKGLKFWISGYYPKGFHHQSPNGFVDLSNSSFGDLVGENISHQGQLKLRFNDYPCIFLDGETNIRSSFNFLYEYTFFFLGRKLHKKASGRLFSSGKGNNVLGWFGIYDQTLWVNQEIYRKKHSSDKEIHLWIVRVFDKDPESAKGEITFYDGDFQLVTTSFYKTKYYNVVLGQPVLYKAESLKGYIYEVICFDYGLNDEEIKTVRNFIKKYYSYKNGFN